MAIGNPITLTNNVDSKSITIVATEGQTSFTPSGGYSINNIEVYRNGVRLVDGKDYTARDGVTVNLVNGSTLDDVVSFQIFDDFRVTGAISQNETEQTIDGNLNIVGILSATTLTGAGGDITGIATGVSINAAGGAFQRVMLGNVTAGIANTMANTADLYYNNTTSTLYASNVNISGTMTQEDVQNVDSTGIVTGGLGLRATKGGVHVLAGVSTFAANVDAGTVQIAANSLDISTGGVDIDGLTNLDETIVAGASTFTANVQVSSAATVGLAKSLSLAYGAYLNFGNADDMQIYHNGSDSYIVDRGTGELKISGSVITIEGTGETLAKFTDDGAAELYYDNSKKLDTIGTGITVTGGVNASGLSTFQGASFTPGSLMKETAYSGFSTGWQAAGDINVSNGNVQYNPHFLDGTSNTLNIVSTVGINTDLQIAESISVTGITSVRETVAFVNALKIDHASVFVNWVGGAAPTAGGALGLDTYAFTIVKLGNNSYSVIGNQVLTSA